MPSEVELESHPTSHDPANVSITAHFQDVPVLTQVPSDVDHSPPGSGGSATHRSTGSVLQSPQETPTESSMVSKFLVSRAVTPAGPKIAPPKACLLTSAEAVAILEEKERKKQQKKQKRRNRGKRNGRLRGREKNMSRNRKQRSGNAKQRREPRN